MVKGGCAALSAESLARDDVPNETGRTHRDPILELHESG
jgi:hypothetical protein